MKTVSDPASAEEQSLASAGAPLTAVPVATPDDSAGAAEGLQAPAQAPDDGRSAVIAAIIRNGLSNSPISQSEATWQALETRLPEIVAALLLEA
jgi:hypothetical protein